MRQKKRAFFFLVTIKPFFFCGLKNGPQESSSLGSKDEVYIILFAFVVREFPFLGY